MLFRLSYDNANYSTLFRGQQRGTSLLQVRILASRESWLGSGAMQDTYVVYQGPLQSYYMGEDVTDNNFKIGMGQVIGNTPAIVMTPDSNIGIGTTTPMATLQVTNDAVSTSNVLSVTSASVGSLPAACSMSIRRQPERVATQGIVSLNARRNMLRLQMLAC